LSQRLTDLKINGDVPWHAFTGGMGGPRHLPLSFRAR
jgi:hypothetical protein